MLNAFLSLWHVDLLVWCQLVLVGVLGVGTFILTIGGTRAHRSELSVTIAGFIAVIATLFTDNLAVLALAFALAVICATCLALHAERAANEKARKTILALCIGSVGLFVVGAALFLKAQMDAGVSSWSALSFGGVAETLATSTLNAQLVQFAFAAVAVGILGAFGLFFMKTRFTSFVGTAAPVVFFIALLRLKQIADVAMADGGTWTDNIFLGFGVLLLLISVIKLVFKKNRQLLSISSIEHIGLVAFMVGAGPAGTIPALIHLGGQAVAHSGLWYAAQDSASVRTRPVIKYLCGALFASLLGAPFSMLFVSELIGVGYALQAYLVLALCVFAILAILSAYYVRAVITLTAQDHAEEATGPMSKHQKIFAAVLAVHVLIMFGVGGYLLTQPGIQFAVSVAQSVASL
ncbi:MAG: hypothetical protein AAB473_05185 [Patescibacteria group bacterium]